MLVSQYIYTACGKDRNGAFSIFSKTKDITDEESSEIREVMMYKTPSGLPYEPTESEIEELFPKKSDIFSFPPDVLVWRKRVMSVVCIVILTRVGEIILFMHLFLKRQMISLRTALLNMLHLNLN